MKFHYHYKFSYHNGEELKLIRNHSWIMRNMKDLPIDIGKTFKIRYDKFIKEI